jgi:manganese/zinc/iron transport system substrate-binding protein
MRYLSCLLVVLTLAALSTTTGCGKSKRARGGKVGPLNLIATTGQVNSALVAITAGTDAQIKLFCGPGVDPHSFSASTNDIQAMKDADAIIYNGFHLEARLHEHLHELFSDKAWAMSSSFPEDARLDWTEDGQQDADAPYDPHIWNHLPGWESCVRGLTEQLIQLQPKNAETFRTNGEKYIQSIQETHQWAQGQLESIPTDRRFIVSAHDAFNYFAKVYNMQTMAVLGIGNEAEADIQTMQKVADMIVEKKIPVIFLEAITNPKISVALKEACQANDWNVEIVQQQLYSDDLGEKTPQDTFLGAFRSNVEIIVENLK